MLENCAQTLVAVDLASPERLALLRKRSVTTSEYRLLNKILGLYPVASIPVKTGIHQYHDETMAVYAQPLETLPVGTFNIFSGKLDGLHWRNTRTQTSCHRFCRPTPL